MELDGRVVVITRGISEIGLALAVRCQKEGAMVVLSDTNEKSLLKIAEETSVIPIAGDTTQPADIKSLVDKTMHRFGRIDLFVSNASLGTLGTGFSNGRDWNASCQSGLLSQMYAVKYMLPQVINRKNGYFLYLIPSTGLFTEYSLDMYSTLKHPTLSFAERMAARYGNVGIKVSVFCSEPFVTELDKTVTNNKCDAVKLQNLAEQVIVGIRQEQFMIFFHNKSKTTNTYRHELQHYEMYGNMRA
jgi:NAD(P)-dependent dehydrogenase (short-subunit alcohol dehydrogenase family)